MRGGVRGPEDVDEMVVDNILQGYGPRGANCAERFAAAVALRTARPDMKYGEIAEQVGLSIRTVDRLARRYGWSQRKQMIDPDDLHHRIAEAIFENPRITVDGLASRVGVNRTSILKYTKSAVEAGVLPAELATRNGPGGREVRR